MPLHPLYGHDAIRNRLAAALAAGRLPQAILLEGTRGVGKQRLALWLAQAIVCEAGKAAPCGECQHCRMVLNLAHPDVHWFVPVELAKKGADPDKQVELVAEALAEEMAARREKPLYEAPGGMAAHGIAAVRLLLRRLGLTPAMARRKVFIIGDAERLIPQRANPEAANALLKALEEPPADTVLILTTSDPESLLPTTLSRVVRVRVTRVQDSVVTSFIQKELPKPPIGAELSKKVAVSEGCIGRLLASEGGGGETATAGGALQEAVGRGPVAGYAFALAQAPFQARGGFTDMLDGLLDRLRAQARAGGETAQVVAAMARVMDAREMAQGNVNPQLLAAVLADDLAPASVRVR
jgi:DNA polymerase III subunit delta'